MSDDQKKNNSQILAKSIRATLSKHNLIPPQETHDTMSMTTVDKTEQTVAAPQKELRTMGWFHTIPKTLLKSDDDPEIKTPEP